MIYEYDYNDLTIEFHYEYEPGEPEIHTYSNGDPGHPGSGPVITIGKAMLVLADIHDHKVTVDISPLLQDLVDLDLDRLEEEILEYIEND